MSRSPTCVTLDQGSLAARGAAYGSVGIACTKTDASSVAPPTLIRVHERVEGHDMTPVIDLSPEEKRDGDAVRRALREKWCRICRLNRCASGFLICEKCVNDGFLPECLSAEESP
jgi:hypothetical protein